MKKLLLFGAIALGGMTANAQWVENFDASTNFPDGWAVINDGDANGFVIQNPEDYYEVVAQTPSNVAVIKYSSSSAHDDYLITKAITVSTGVSDRISFWIRSKDYLENYNVLLSTTDQSKAAFTVELQATAKASDQWVKKIFSLSEYNGQTVYVAIHATDTNQFGLLVDSFVVDGTPSCEEPKDLLSSNIEATTADISWTASASTVNNGYEVYYSTSNIAPDDTTVLDDTNSVSVDASATVATLTGLAPMTNYHAWVRANCSATDHSVWSSSIVFRTKCASTDTPYTMNFDNISPGSVGECEKVINNGQGNQWEVAHIPGQEGNILRYKYDTSYPANSWFFTQGLNLEANKGYIVKFRYGNNSDSVVEKIKVAYGMDKTADAMVHQIVDLTDISDAMYHTVEYTIIPSETGVYYVGFQAHSDADQYYLYLDDISVIEDPSVGTINQELTSLNVYPNPAKDIINISNDVAINNVEIFDINGRRLLNQAVEQTSITIDVSSFATGTYFVKVTAEGKTSTKQIVVK